MFNLSLGRKKKTVLISGDTHNPVIHKHYTDFLVQTYNKFKCDTFVHIGDETDQHSWSKYPKEHDALSPKEEWAATVKSLKKTLYKAFPEAQVCNSNHTIRIYKTAHSAGLQTNFLKSIKEILEAPPNWFWSDFWVMDGVLYFHGEPYSGMLAHKEAAQQKGINIVMGHIHTNGGVEFVRTEAGERWGLATGWGGDETSYNMRYAKASKHKPILGCGVVIEGKYPIFVPMKTS